MLAGTQREKIRIRAELGQIRGGIALLMKQRNGGKWTHQERLAVQGIVRSISNVSPYFVVWILPGSVLILPLLAWHLDVRRQHRIPAAG